jgi:hypothetical protein
MKTTALLITLLLSFAMASAQSSTRYVFKCKEKMHYTIVSEGDTLKSCYSTKRLVLKIYQEAEVYLYFDNGFVKQVFLDQMPGLRKQVIIITNSSDGVLKIQAPSE